jgi:hypothetical protein
MKYIKTLIFILLTLNIFAQNPISFEDVVKVEAKKKELHNRATVWSVSAFNNSKSAIQSNTDDEIIIKTNFTYNQKKMIWGGSDGSKGHITFIIQLNFKEGRYKYQLKDFYHEPISGGGFGLITDAEKYQGKMGLTSKGWRKKIWNDLKESIDLKSKVLIMGLTEAMEAESEIEKDW